jgi:hypothetical protein
VRFETSFQIGGTTVVILAIPQAFQNIDIIHLRRGRDSNPRESK